MTNKTFKCSVCGATNIPHKGKGLCRNCYMRAYRKKQSGSEEDGRLQIVEAIKGILLSKCNVTVLYENNRLRLVTYGRPILDVTF